MRYFSIDVRAVSPLALRADHAAKGSRTAEYISGTVLMGGLAAVHRLLYPHDTPDFEDLFLKDRILYPNLYPAMFGDEGMQESNLPVYPFPRTARTCKRFSGFLYKFKDEDKDEDEERHGVRDALLDWAMFKLSESSEEIDSQAVARLIGELKAHKSCHQPRVTRICLEAMDEMEGYYRREDDEPYHMIAAESTHSSMRLQTYTGINRELGTVEEGILYNREVFEEGSRFWGVAKLPDDEKLVDKFKKLICEANKEGLLRVGTGRTRGLGKVKIVTNTQSNGNEMFDAFKARLLKFQQALEKRAQAKGVQLSHPFYFTLTLHSPLILADESLRYRGRIDGETLAKEAGLPEGSLRLLYEAAGGQRIAGWNELWGMPRTAEYAIDSGSVFLFASALQVEDAWLERLFALEEAGMGRRRAEGFGRVCFSDPFHLQEELQ